MVTHYADQIERALRNDSNSISLLIDELRNRGYENRFTINHGKLTCIETQKQYRSLCFHVDGIYRFKGWLGNQLGCSVFALRHRTDNLKGMFIAIGISHNL